jgi:hypothetical protein
MADDHHDEQRPDYDPEHVELPERAPPLRSTAPQSSFTMAQVSKGAGVALGGLAVTVGLGLVIV